MGFISSPARGIVIPGLCLFFALFLTPNVLAQSSGEPRDAGQELQVVIEQDPALFHSIPTPPEFFRAVEAESRTHDGLPGKDYWQQETRYWLEARLDTEGKRLEGKGRFRYVNNSPDTLYQLNMELVQNFHSAEAARNEAAEITDGVTIGRLAANGSVLREGSTSGPRYTVNGTQLQISPGAPIGPGVAVEIEASWSFKIPQSGAGNRMGHSRDNLFFLAYWYPVFSVYDDVEGWHTDPFLGQSEFYYGFADYDVKIDLPAGWIAAATGDLQNAEQVLAPAVFDRLQQAYRSDQTVRVLSPADFGHATRQSDGRQTWHFKASRVRDFAFSATRQSIWDAARVAVGEGRYAKVNTFYRETASRWTNVTHYQQHAIGFLSRYTGFPYPFPQITAVEGADIIGGGMEYPMMTLIGDYNVAGDEPLYDVTAHELAHMWIPMIVGTDERRYGWMDEGSTTFNENQARADFFPDDEPELADQVTYTNVARNGLEGEIMRWSSYHYTPLAYVTASYPKPAMLLATLRAILGEETFKSAFSQFIRDWAFKHPYPYDFFNAFERESGQDLDWFWNAWYYETWTLDQAVKSVTQRGRKTEIQIENVGKVPMPVRLSITLQNGEVIQEEIPVDEWLTGARTLTVILETPSRVEQVEIDEALHFPDIERGNNVWSR